MDFTMHSLKALVAFGLSRRTCTGTRTSELPGLRLSCAQVLDWVQLYLWVDAWAR
jgi:hypothetical protein